MTAGALLPLRLGHRPQTSSAIPHVQLDQQPADGRLSDAIIDEAGAWPHVQEQESGVSAEGARALVLHPPAARGPAEAFLVGREFCHAHPDSDHSFHATLPAELAAEAVLAGWCTPHPLVRAGKVPPTFVMLHAPRDDSEAQVVLALVRSSFLFASAGTAHRSPAGEPATNSLGG